MLPAAMPWEGLRLKAELEVKGVRYPGSLGMPAEGECRWLVDPAA